MFILAVGELPDHWFDVLILPVILMVIGGTIWFAGRNAELKDNAKPWKWAAALPFALALYCGWGPFMRLRDSFYVAAIKPLGGKMQMAHYAAFFLPIVFMAALAVWEVYDRKRALADE